MSNIHRFASLVFAVAVAVTAVRPVQAEGLLEGLAFTNEPSPIAGQVIVRTVPSRWSDRCLPVRWRVNDTQDPIRNPWVESPVTVADATKALTRALGTWNEVSTRTSRCGS